ncbi:MAG: DUF4410 domain-containing protein [Candidatus Omnitrophica bacterium]|nr:DUF4410 domain-containing protein [Candidatus Omnitrophota bacterium]
MLKQVIFICLIILIPLIAGCSTPSNSLKVDYSDISKLSSAGNLEVVVICKAKTAEKEIVKIGDAVVSQLKNIGVFKNVYGVQSNGRMTSDLRLEVTITALKPVSKSARFLIGALAGQGKIEARIDLLDLAAKRQVVWANVSGSTSTGSALAGTTEEAIDQLAAAIAKIFQEKVLKQTVVKDSDKACVQPFLIKELGENLPAN